MTNSMMTPEKLQKPVTLIEINDLLATAPLLVEQRNVIRRMSFELSKWRGETKQEIKPKIT